jgi:hypothetical protein
MKEELIIIYLIMIKGSLCQQIINIKFSGYACKKKKIEKILKAL